MPLVINALGVDTHILMYEPKEFQETTGLKIQFVCVAMLLSIYNGSRFTVIYLMSAWFLDSELSTYLNQACVWLLEIAFVHASVCVCVCPREH